MNKVSVVTPDLPSDLHYRVCMPTDGSGAARLGQLIRRTRNDIGWTQKDLAEEADVSVETIKRYENGKIKSPESELVRKLVQALKLDVREIPVALGLVTREEMGLPPAPPPRRWTPTMEQLIEALEDDDVTEDEKLTILDMLNARRARRAQKAAGTPPVNRRRVS